MGNVQVILTKSGFLDYRQCAKSYWLKLNRPHEVDWPAPGAFAQMLIRQGFEIEEQVRLIVSGWPHRDDCSFQMTFQANGLEARADLVHRHADGSIDLYEIKSSTGLKGSGGDHVEDVAFQTIVAERGGLTVRHAHVIHVNKHYVRSGDIDPHQLLVIVDVTIEVRERYTDLAREIDDALAFLSLPELDEAGCSCRFIGNPANHCVTFERFNPAIRRPSVYVLPRVSANKLKAWEAEGRFDINSLTAADLTPLQRPVLEAVITGQPVINHPALRRFIDQLEWPLHFYDYETFASAIPLADGHRPHAAMAVQFSLHRLEASGALSHHEFLADGPGQQRALVEALEACIGAEGSVISWNKSFEATCNKTMAALLPDKASFLERLNARTHDLMEPFATDYVDARFGGSTSIKKVLPVLVPTLAYSDTDVHDGTGAMEAWVKFIGCADPVEKAELRRQLLAYCKLDSLAMVEIYRCLRVTAQQPDSASG